MSVDLTAVDGNNTHTLDTNLIALAMHKLSIDNTNVTDVLTDCNIYLTKLNRCDLLKSANLMDLNLIFDCLNTTEQTQIEMSCALLQKLLSILPPNHAFNKYSASIERAIHHPNDTVKSTILSELEKMLANDNNVDIQVDLACTIVDCLTSSDMTVSYNAVKCLKRFQSVETLSSIPILSKLQTIMAMDAKIRTRVYDILIHWAKSVDALALISSKGLFTNLVKDITYPDVMMQMVTIQMLIPLSITEYGFDYLNSIGIISGLYRLLSSNPKELDDPSVVILNPIVLEFFIKVTQVRPLFVFTTYPKVFVVIYEVLKEGDDSLVGVAINAITTLASSWECKILLDNPSASTILHYDGDDELDIWSIFIIELSRIASSTKTELKAGAIQAITKIIQVENGELSLRNDMIERTKKWYKQLKDNPLKNIVHASCIVPFLNIQQAGYEMLQTLAEQPWGQEEINKCSTLLDLVFKDCPKDPIPIKDLKKMIIKTLLESNTSKNTLSEELLFRIQHSEVIKSNENAPQPDVLVENMAI
ncbi:26S proteasome non-ATPase regulatory subunit 5-like isoform X2 [Metopolophium dirhodum]|uniref:26S proteasome non-ATPase regulatory subunit 5-like isoform X1 n=1 Tax=Metopolophium dirhodum TaxID=44670 RepID=UPI00298FC8E9|nr:26S proteasome non-ATPase regulatory subunit 5-like isoform X1 [Metopolophium dirhodum]XP_060874929.1 26S proteasome non-ATPase regulatory subunit 5-like isoform X2 [Metopolophium dirhodum]